MQYIQGGAAMYLNIDGKILCPQPDQSLLDLIRKADMDSVKLSKRPIAAKIAGEVFTLNYVPLRQKDIAADRPSMRRAMAASNGEVHLLYCSDAAGREAYIRTAQFVIFLALRQLWPEARGKMNCTLGSSVYIQVTGAKDFSVSMSLDRLVSLIILEHKLVRHFVS